MSDLYVLHRLTLTTPAEPLFAALSTAVPGLSRHQARRAIMAGLVQIDGVKQVEPKHPLPASCAVTLDLRHGIDRAFNARIKEGVVDTAKPFTVLYEDAQVVVVDKTAGVLSAPTKHEHLPGDEPERGHVPEQLRRMWRRQKREVKFIGLVHRLDQETSGCLCFAMSREAQRLLSAQFAGSAAGRTYRCLVHGAPKQDADVLKQKLGRGHDGRRTVVDEDEEGKDAVTSFKVLKRFAHASELEVTLETGRTHQIRVALLAIGCPVVGDRVYGFRDGDRRAKPGEQLPRPPRMMLHAERLGLDHPGSGKRIECVAPLPEEYVAYRKLLG